MTIKCHDFWKCKKHECIMFEEVEGKKCWEVDPSLTHCSDVFKATIRTNAKIVFCRNCSFYKHVNATEPDEFTFRVNHH